MDCYPKRLESYRANDISCLLIFSHEELTSPGSVRTHTPSPGVGKVGGDLINRGCAVPRERFESHLSQHQDPGGPQGMQAGGGVTLHTLHQDHVLISHGATREVRVPACFPQAKRLTGGSPWECFVSYFSFFFSCGRAGTHTSGQTQPPSTPGTHLLRWSGLLLSTPGCSHSQALLLLSFPFPLSSPGAAESRQLHGDRANTHLQAKRN